MFDLERAQRYLIIFLVTALLAGIGLTQYRRSRPPVPPHLSKFSVGKPPSPAESVKVNINEAGPEELMKLRGVGKVLAGRIIEYRSSRGPFASTGDLRKVDGIGPAVYEKLKDDVSIE
jgi:competence protein ComEA